MTMISGLGGGLGQREAADHVGGRRPSVVLDGALRDVGEHRVGPAESVDLHVEVTAEPGKLVRMHVTSGFVFWDGSTWEWELGAATRAPSDTGVLFRHYGFGEGYAEIDLGHTAQTWAQIMNRLAGYVASGEPLPFFPARTTMPVDV